MRRELRTTRLLALNDLARELTAYPRDRGTIYLITNG
jgi:hypothetical protein